MTTDATLDDRQDIYGFSGQSSVQMMYSPVMHKTGDNSIRMEQIYHIKAQTRVSNDNPSTCLKEEASKPDIESFKRVEPIVICSKVEAAEEGNLVEDETIAATDSKSLPVDKELVIGIDLNKVPTSKMEEEVNQEEAVEIPEDQSGYKEGCRIAGHVEMTPDATLDEGYCRGMITHFDKDVITPVNTFRVAVEKEHVVEANIDVSLQPHEKLVMDSATGTGTNGIDDQNNVGNGHGTWLEELLQPDKKLLDTEIDTEILCTTAELEVMGNMVYTEFGNDERKVEIPIYQSGNTTRQKGKHSQILPSGNTLFTNQTYSAGKSINTPGCSDYMKVGSRSGTHRI